MLRNTATIIAAIALASCANIEHKTPEARQKIKQDLKIPTIIDTAFTSYCWLWIGGPNQCKYTPGISVLTPDSLILVSYENETYVHQDTLKTEDIKCVSDGDGHTFFAFRKQQAVSIIPYTEVHRAPPINNPIYREKAIKLLTSNGQQFLQGEKAKITQKTGSKEYGVQSIYTGAGPIPIVTSTDAEVVINPCLTQ